MNFCDKQPGVYAGGVEYPQKTNKQKTNKNEGGKVFKHENVPAVAGFPAFYWDIPCTKVLWKLAFSGKFRLFFFF